MKFDWCAYRFISGWTYFCIFFFFFWQQCYSEVDWNCIWTTIFFTGPIYKKSWFFDCHSQLVNYWRSGMVRQVGRHLHSTSDDLKMRLKNELFFQMGPFLKKKNVLSLVCAHIHKVLIHRASVTETPSTQLRETVPSNDSQAVTVRWKKLHNVAFFVFSSVFGFTYMTNSDSKDP